MQVQGLLVSAEGLLPHGDSLAITLPKCLFEEFLLLPFPSVTCVQSLAQRSVPHIVLADLGARVLL